jgi:hypothetical protein
MIGRRPRGLSVRLMENDWCPLAKQRRFPLGGAALEPDRHLGVGGHPIPGSPRQLGQGIFVDPQALASPQPRIHTIWARGSMGEGWGG